MNERRRARICAAAVSALDELRAATARTFAAERILEDEAASLRLRGDAALDAHAQILAHDAATLAATRAVLEANEEQLLARVIALRATLATVEGTLTTTTPVTQATDRLP